MTTGIPPLELGPNGEMPKILGVARYLLRDPNECVPCCDQPLIEASEHKIIAHILGQPDIFTWFFEFMLEPAIGPRPREKNVDILCGTRRSDVGLDPSEKPGDFDMVLLPEWDGAYYLNMVMAIEVKILRLPTRNRSIHVRPSGAAQARGLVRDGIPFVGLLHIILPEPSPPEQWNPLARCQIINDNLEAETLPGIFPTDTIGVDAVRRHFGRMRRYVDGTCIGAKAIAPVLDHTGCKIVGRDLSDSEICPTANPNIDRDLLKQFCHIAASFKQLGRL